MRPGPAKTALIVDLVGNCHRLGLPDDDREWTLEDGEVTERRKTKPRLAVCDRCQTGFYGRECPNCRFVTPLPPVEEIVTPLEEVKSKKPRGKPKTKRKEALAQAHVLVAQCQSREQFIREARRLANNLGFNPGWEYVAADLVWDVRQRQGG